MNVDSSGLGMILSQEARLREGKAYTLLPLEAVIVTGVDRLTWLHNITTAPFAALRPGVSIEALILDPRGHIMHACAAVDDGMRTWLLTDQGRSEDMAEYLRTMRFMMRVDMACMPVTAVGMMCEREAVAPEVQEKASIIWEDPWPYVQQGGASYGISDEDHPGKNSHRIVLISSKESSKELSKDTRVAHEGAPEENLAEDASIPPLIQALKNEGLEEVSSAAWEAARIVDRRPRPNMEVMHVPDPGVLPNELDWLRTAVSLKKGCFPGQETVAKIVNMGRPARRLTFLYLEGPEGQLPEPSSALSFDGEEVGVVTSVARDNELGPVALALVKRTVPPDAVLKIISEQAPGFVASQETIVSLEGRSSASPDHIPGEQLRKARLSMAAGGKSQRRSMLGRR